MPKKEPSCELEKELFKNVCEKTPDYVKNLDLLNFDNDGAFTFTLKREHLYPHSEQNPEGLGLLEWFGEFIDLTGKLAAWGDDDRLEAREILVDLLDERDQISVGFARARRALDNQRFAT